MANVQITTPVGRLVQGHPMKTNPVTDDAGLAKLQKDGITPRSSTYVAVAVPKGAETHWNQTPWGAAIWKVGAEAWVNNEFNAPTFAWKVSDGDSTVPNKKGKIPANNEGFPGHWIVRASTELNGLRCFNHGKYDPLRDVIQDAGAIKCGDYCRLVVSIKGNGATGTQNPGVYVNPDLFELYRAGVQIITETGADAAATLGATAADAQLPANAAVDTGVAAPAPGATPAPPVTPDPAFAQGPAAPPAPPAKPRRVAPNGKSCTEAELATAGWTPAQIADLPVDVAV